MRRKTKVVEENFDERILCMEREEDQQQIACAFAEDAIATASRTRPRGNSKRTMTRVEKAHSNRATPAPTSCCGKARAKLWIARPVRREMKTFTGVSSE